MGIFGKLFGRDNSARPTPAATEDPADVRRNGAQVIRPEQTLSITGRGVVVTGELLVPVEVGDKFDVTHRGTTEEMRTTSILIDKVEQKTAGPGTTATLMLNLPVRIR